MATPTQEWLAAHKGHNYEPWTPDFQGGEAEVYFCYDCNEEHIRFRGGGALTTTDAIKKPIKQEG